MPRSKREAGGQEGGGTSRVSEDAMETGEGGTEESKQAEEEQAGQEGSPAAAGMRPMNPRREAWAQVWKPHESYWSYFCTLCGGGLAVLLNDCNLEIFEDRRDRSRLVSLRRFT